MTDFPSEAREWRTIESMGSDWRILCGGGAQTPLDLMRYHLKQKNRCHRQNAEEREEGEGEGRRESESGE